MNVALLSAIVGAVTGALTVAGVNCELRPQSWTLQSLVLGENGRRQQAGMIGRLELRWGQVAQRRVDALVLVDVIQEVPDLRVGVSEVTLLG